MMKYVLWDVDDISVFKEAEKGASKLCCTDCKAVICEEKCECWNFAKKGAEFGYNKANEWHYVKDNDLPKENKMCLLYLGSSFNPITGWIENGIWYFEDDRKSSVWQTKVIAWKEITLPKEIKQND